MAKMSLYACLYFDCDKSVSVLPKNKCKLRGPFKVKSEVDVDWRDENGNKERLVATIIKVEGKGKLSSIHSQIVFVYSLVCLESCFKVLGCSGAAG